MTNLLVQECGFRLFEAQRLSRCKGFACWFDFKILYMTSPEAEMSGTRRRFFQDAAFFGAGVLGLTEALRGDTQVSDPQAARAMEQGRHHSPYGNHKKKEVAPTGPDPFLPMVTPDLPDLPHELDGGVKVFKLVGRNR